MKSNLFVYAFLLFSSFCMAQEYDLSGTVNDASGMGLPGVNIVVKGSTKGTSTDFDGNFLLPKVLSGSTLVFSSIGYVTFEYKVTNANKITVTLQEDTKALEEVVVIGYGTQKKREVTGAVSTVSSETLDILKPVKVEQALQGTISGVNVTTQSGSPGAGLDIRIRGIGTNGDNRPTVIIDGYVGELGLLNPNDIETITVLKDAQAAIYGTIGANGVILITTKAGRKNAKTSINYNTYVGFQETSRKIPLLNATEYALILNESYANNGQNLPFPNTSGLGKGTDWQDEVFSKGVPIINHDLNVTGGSEKVSYAFSGSHIDQQGIVGKDKSGFLRNTARLSLNADLTDKLKVQTNVIYTYFNRKTLNENNLGSVLFNALNAPPTYSTHDANGEFTKLPLTGLGSEIINPLAQIDNTYNDYNFKQITGTFGLEYELFKGFKLTSRIGFKTANSENRDFAKEVYYGENVADKVFDNPRSRVTQGAVNDNNYTFDMYGVYTKSFNERHNFAFTAGTTVYKEWGNGLFATGFDVPNNSWEFADIGATLGGLDTKYNSSYSYDVRRLSYFGRLQYDYNGKYLFSAMLRRDSSSRFGPENRVAYFPSATAGWILSDEPFIENSKILSFLKLRASYGTLGNDLIGNFNYLSLLQGEATYIFNGQLVNGAAIGVVSNPNVKWEEAKKFDVGFDIRLFNDKLEVVTDYFIDTRKDLLVVGVPISGISGIAAPGSGSPTINAGDTRNSGLEFAVNYKNKIGEKFNFNLGYNVTFLKNEVTALNNNTGFIEGGSFGVQPNPVRMEVGMPMGYFYGYKTDGIFQNQDEVNAHPSQIALGAAASPGDIRFVDVNGDGVIDANDRTNIGDPIPDATMGFNIQLNYGNFDFSMFTFASVGNDMIRSYERTQPDVNRFSYVLDRWTGEGTSNSVPRVTTGATANNVFSDYFVEDASYVRIQNIQLGYSIPTQFIEKVGLSKVRLYAAANNLYTFTKYKGFDPGASSGAPIGGGIDNGFYPVPKTYIFGLNINF